MSKKSDFLEEYSDFLIEKGNYTIEEIKKMTYEDLKDAVDEIEELEADIYPNGRDFDSEDY